VVQGEKGRVIQVAIITAVALLGDAMLFIVLPIYYEQFGLTALWQIGLLLSINRLIRLPINPFVAWFYRRYSLRTGLFIATTLAALTTFSYGVATSFIVLVIARMLWGVAWSFLRMGGFLTIIKVSTNENRGNHIGLYNGLWGMGGLVGMLAGGFLADQIPIVMMTSLFALLALICIPLIAFTVPHSNVDHRTTAKAISPTFQFTPYISLILVTSLFKGFLIMGLFASTLSPLIESRMQEPMTIASLMIGAATIAGIVQAIRWCWDPFFAPLIGRWSDRLEKRYTLLFVPLIAGGVLLVVVGFTESTLLLIGLLLLFQLTSTMLTTTVDTLAASAAANTDEVKMTMWHTILDDLGAAVGPLSSFLLLTWLEGSLSILYVGSGLLMLSYAVIWGSYYYKSKRKTTHANAA